MKKVCYLTVIFAMSASCTTMFKSHNLEVIQTAGKNTPVFTRKAGNSWLSLNYKPTVKEDPINDILSMGRWSIASLKLKERLKAKPGDEQLLTVLASALFMEKKHRAAKFYARQVLKFNPKNHSAQNILGLYYLYNAQTKHDFKRAERMFKLAFKSSPTEVASGLNLGFLYLRQKNAFFAQETFTEVIARCKNCQAAYLGLGIAHYQRQQFKDAIAAFEKGIDIEDSDEILFHLALVYRYGVKSLDKAREYFNKIARNTVSVRSLRNRARSEVAIIDEKQLYRYQQKYNPKGKKSFSDTYMMQTADKDFDIHKSSK